MPEEKAVDNGKAPSGFAAWPEDSKPIMSLADKSSGSSSSGSHKRKKTPVPEMSEAGKDEEDIIVDKVVATQAEVARKKRAVEVGAKPGTVPAYVHPTGAVFGPVKLAEKRQQPERASSSPMETPGGIIMVRIGPGAVWPDSTSSRFRITQDWAATSVLMVDNVNARLQSVDGLMCRLHGLSICDNAYIATSGRKGSCLTFVKALDFTYHVYLSEQFLAECPRHGEVLLGHGHFENCKLRVYRGSKPEKPNHPRLTYEVRPETVDNLASNHLNLDGLLMKLGVLRPE